ncbi:hypothetical protein ATCM_12660 [Stenotrophomonas sp. ATCM1_4]|uniref:hypothetical protein n=1 Tax=Stenotrophomonas sp. ATCM1_4 TaxID=2259330 RepID=UPI001047CAD1|nr:hypothetical protein [Stenotrophomonas sp. ATCM1_4]TDB28434.1 hypothetical protein ATCM_12660 [Stenotrophomonas sp. ATCM1_4]
MSMLDGVSQCWPLAKDCLVWWDAWAAVGALLGFIATAILGFFTYRLGRAANRATRLATQIAATELDRQQLRDNKERVLVLVQIAGELSINLNKVRDISAFMGTPGYSDALVSSRKARDEFFNALDAVTFPVVRGVTERLHYLTPTDGARLVRAMGVLAVFQELRPENPDPDDLAEGLGVLSSTLPKVIDDLRIVWEASQAAVRELGIHDIEFARSVAGQQTD